MKILIVSLGIPGHLNPMLGAASVLASEHQVCVQTSVELRGMVDAAKLAFLPEPAESSTFVGHFVAGHPQFLAMPPDIERVAYGLEHYVAASIPKQAANIQRALASFPADLIMADSAFFGTLPLLLGPRAERPAIAHLGITVLNPHSVNNLRPRPGVTREAFLLERAHFERVLVDPVQAAFDRALHVLGLGPLSTPAMESLSQLPDLYIHPGIRGFEYPNRSPIVHFIGRLPLPEGQVLLPSWWQELDPSKRLVLVTQGTIANRDFGQLVGPTLSGLANERDLLVLVTTGGEPIANIPGPIPANARVATFLPFEKILPSVDLLITNGGYGTVNMALADGVPIVSAGLTEDKEEVSARVEWSGVGLDLHTNQPSPARIRRATREVLDEPGHRTRARELAAEFARSDAKAELLALVGTLGR